MRATYCFQKNTKLCLIICWCHMLKICWAAPWKEKCLNSFTKNFDSAATASPTSVTFSAVSASIASASGWGWGTVQGSWGSYDRGGSSDRPNGQCDIWYWVVITCGSGYGCWGSGYIGWGSLWYIGWGGLRYWCSCWDGWNWRKKCRKIEILEKSNLCIYFYSLMGENYAHVIGQAYAKCFIY